MIDSALLSAIRSPASNRPERLKTQREIGALPCVMLLLMYTKPSR